MIHDVVDFFVVFISGLHMSDGRDAVLVSVEDDLHLLINFADFGLRIYIHIGQKPYCFC